MLPISLAVAIAIKMESPGPVLFTQWRVGWRERPFRLLKFRSMRQDAEAIVLDFIESNQGPPAAAWPDAVDRAHNGADFDRRATGAEAHALLTSALR